MKLGWYARLVIVLALFWTLGKAGHEYAEKQTMGIRAQAGEFRRCIEMEYQKVNQAGRRPGESCSEYSERQFPWLFGWESFSNELLTAALSAAFYALLSITFYWAFRWIWEGRPKGWRQRPTEL